MTESISPAFAAASGLPKGTQITDGEVREVRRKTGEWERINRRLENIQRGIKNREGPKARA